MKNTFKRGIAAVLLVLGMTSVTGCFYYRHDSDYAYRDRDWSYRRDYDDHWRDRYYRGRYASNGPRHYDWNYD